MEGVGDAEVDQARRAAHDDVGGLDVEVDDALGREVVQGGGDVQAEREQLLEREGPSRVSELVERRAVEVLEHEVREAAAELGAEAAHDDRVGEAGDELGLALEVAQRGRVAAPWSGRRTLATSTASRCSSQTSIAS